MSLKSYALTTVARACGYLDIAVPTGTDLTAFENLINSLTEYIEKYIGRRIKLTAYTNEEYDTERAETLSLKNFPVSTTATFTLQRRTSDLNVDDWETVDSDYYHVDHSSGVIEGASGMRFARTSKGYRASYTAGYDFDNTSTFLGDTEAGDIELAAWMLLGSVWNSRKGGGSSGITSERIGDYSITWAKAVMQSDDVKAILDAYSSGGLAGGAGGGAGVGVIGPLTPVQG